MPDDDLFGGQHYRVRRDETYHGEAFIVVRVSDGVEVGLRYYTRRAANRRAEELEAFATQNPSLF